MMTILKKEILENLTTYRFYVLTGLLCLLMLISIIVSYGDYRLRLENYNTLQPQGSNHENIIIPPNPLSIIAKGLDANLGRLYKISALGIEVNPNQQSINRLFSLFTVPDMLFIIRVVLALCALLFSFDAISGERENGTLKLILAGGGQRVSLLLGKLFGRFTLVYVPFLVLFLVAVITVSVLPDVQAGSYYWERVGLILVVSGVYVLVFSSLGTSFSCLVHRSSTSMMFSLAFWVFFVFVVPNMGVTIAQSMSDVPPGDRVEMESRLSTVQAIFETIQHVKSSGDQKEFARIMVQVKEANSHLLETYRPKLNRLINVTQDIVRISPSGALSFLITEIANTGMGEELRLKDAIILYVNRNFNRLAGLEKSPVEAFEYRPASLGSIFAGSAAIDVLILILFAFGFIGFAMTSFLRYDPR